MRIVYQIPGDLSAGPLGSAERVRRRDQLQEWAGHGVAIEVHDSPGGPPAIENAVDEALSVTSMIEAVKKRPAPVDALIVGCFGDPGLAALRETLDYPVIGPMESSFHLAVQLGRRVGIVTVLDSVIPLLDGLVRQMGEIANYAGSRSIGIPVLKLPDDPSTLAERSYEAARELTLEAGADVICLGCMSMAFQELDQGLSRQLGLPVVNPARSALKTAEIVVSMGLKSSRRTYPRLHLENKVET